MCDCGISWSYPVTFRSQARAFDAATFLCWNSCIISSRRQSFIVSGESMNSQSRFFGLAIAVARGVEHQKQRNRINIGTAKEILELLAYAYSHFYNMLSRRSRGQISLSHYPTSISSVCEQVRLWRDCAYVQARLSLYWSLCDNMPCAAAPYNVRLANVMYLL